MQNLTVLASAVPEISLVASKSKVGHVTLTTPHLRVRDYYLCWDLTQPTGMPNLTTLSSEDMVVDHQNLNVSRDLTTPLSGIVYHSRASTCYNRHIYQI